jgi:hypothetical protein
MIDALMRSLVKRTHRSAPINSRIVVTPLPVMLKKPKKNQKIPVCTKCASVATLRVQQLTDDLENSEDYCKACFYDSLLKV